MSRRSVATVLRSRRVFLPALLTSIALLSSFAGAFVVHHRLWPSLWLRNVFMAVSAVRVQLSPPDRFSSYFYHRSRTAETGVRHHDPLRALPGLTLFTSGHAQKAFLVTMTGDVAHEWHLPFSAVWDDPPHFDRTPAADDLITWRKAVLYPNGDLLAVYGGMGVPWGYGLAKMNKDSRLLWKYDAHVHHDVAVGADGRIYTLTQEVLTEPIPGLGERIAPPVIEDFIVVLSAEGKQQQKLSISQAIMSSAHASLVKMLEPTNNGDLWHANGVEPLGDDFARHHDMFSANQLLISLRAPHAIAVVDLELERVVWASLGPWRGQHDPDPLPNGNMLLFDNRGHCGHKARSRVIELSPTSLAVQWQYAGTEELPLDSDQRGSQQRLANGNTLITESFEGRILEVTSSGALVWEFLSPFRDPQDPRRVAYTHWARRIDPETLLFDPTGAR